MSTSLLRWRGDDSNPGGKQRNGKQPVLSIAQHERTFRSRYDAICVKMCVPAMNIDRNPADLQFTIYLHTFKSLFKFLLFLSLIVQATPNPRKRWRCVGPSGKHQLVDDVLRVEILTWLGLFKVLRSKFPLSKNTEVKSVVYLKV